MTVITQRPTQPLRDEHKGLLPYVENVLRVADAVSAAPITTLLTSLDTVYEFLARGLIPHAEAEDQALYPFAADVLGAPEATAMMISDHSEIGRLVEQLGLLRAQLETEPLNAFRANELRRILYGLYALIKLHFAREEEIFLPALDEKASPDAIYRVFTEMKAIESAHENAEAPVAGAS